MESLEAVVGDSEPLDGRFQAAQMDTVVTALLMLFIWFILYMATNITEDDDQSLLIYGQWSEVESLIKELQQMDGIQSVSKGRFFLSPGLAPTFQVWRSIFKALAN